MQVINTFLQKLLLEIMNRWISLHSEDVLNGMVILETTIRGNKEKKRFEKWGIIAWCCHLAFCYSRNF